MAGMAQSAVDSLLGRLSALLVDEAQLLRGVRGDVRFIRDEMESMNSLLAHLTEAQHRAHHVRTWMKQVVGLARDSEAYVELFARHVGSGGDPRAGAGLLGFLRRMVWLLGTIPVRHRVAKQIKELKTRVREVDERRLRYGVTVPSSSSKDAPSQQAGALTLFDEAAEQQLRTPSSYGRSMLELEEEVLFDKGTDRIVDQLIVPHLEENSIIYPDWKKIPTTYIMQDRLLLDRLLILQILYEDKDKALAARVARAVYNHPSLPASTFGCKLRMNVGNWPCMDSSYYDDYEYEYIFLREVLAQVAPAQPIPQLFGEDENYGHKADKLSQQIMGHLRGRRFLILLEQVKDHRRRDYLLRRLLGPEDRDGELVLGSFVITTSSDSSSPYYIIINPRIAVYEAMYEKARELINYSPTEPADTDSLIKSTSEGPAHCTWGHVQAILGLCYPDAFAMKMFLHLLQANPRRTDDELHNIKDIISRCIRLNRSISKQMLIFCYSELPAKYRSCLMYMSIFPKDRVITRTSLARRWIAEGIINPTREYYSSTEEGRLDRPTTTVLEDVAMHHFEMLVSRGFIRPVELGAACNIKTCTVHPETFEFIARIAADVNFVDTDNLPQALAQHLSIHSRIPQQVSYHPIEATTPPVDAIVASLPYLARSSQWKLLKVLDLEGCRGLRKKHLKIICNILLLRYFSLRNTDVTELPKQIEMLTCLETLDIRQTAVRAFATKSVMLPMLKHMLAGQSKTHPPPASSNCDTRFLEPFVAVRLPSGVQRMKKLEMLSHVQVSHGGDEDILSIGQLLRLRKLGVVLRTKKRDGLLHLLLQQIEKLHDCLLSLSIIQVFDQPVTSDGIIHDDADEVPALPLVPKFLRSLNIRGIGIRRGLPHWIAQLDQLVKLTLSETYLGEDALGIIGNLSALACLRLLHKSYSGNKLHIKKGEFNSLKSLIIQGDEITWIDFDVLSSSSRLEMIVWSFAKLDAINGLQRLPNLKKVELNGDCNPNLVRFLGIRDLWLNGQRASHMPILPKV